MKDRKAFSFYRSYYEVALILPEEARLQYLMAILERQFKDKHPGFIDEMARFAYISQKHSIDKQIEGYKNSLKRRKKRD